MDQLQEYRHDKDQFFATDPHSPLTTRQKEVFVGLQYFDENDALRLEVALESPGDPADVNVQTSTGEVQKYRRLGRFTFQVDGETARLTLYEGEGGLFLPFVDSLAGTETYPAGRYVEPDQLPGGRFLVDFNLAYNPYCAYNEMWSCPLTPFENRLKIPIRAGEKLFQEPNHPATGNGG